MVLVQLLSFSVEVPQILDEVFVAVFDELSFLSSENSSGNFVLNDGLSLLLAFFLFQFRVHQGPISMIQEILEVVVLFRKLLTDDPRYTGHGRMVMAL